MLTQYQQSNKQCCVCCMPYMFQLHQENLKAKQELIELKQQLSTQKVCNDVYRMLSPKNQLRLQSDSEIKYDNNNSISFNIEQRINNFKNQIEKRIMEYKNENNLNQHSYKYSQHTITIRQKTLERVNTYDSRAQNNNQLYHYGQLLESYHDPDEYRNIDDQIQSIINEDDDQQELNNDQHQNNVEIASLLKESDLFNENQILNSESDYNNPFQVNTPVLSNLFPSEKGKYYHKQKFSQTIISIDDINKNVIRSRKSTSNSKSKTQKSSIVFTHNKQNKDDIYYKLVSYVDGQFLSTFDGKTQYIIGQQQFKKIVKTKGMSSHNLLEGTVKGGICVHPTIEDAQKTNFPKNSQLYGASKVILKLKANPPFLKVNNHSYVFTSITPIEAIFLNQNFNYDNNEINY